VDLEVNPSITVQTCELVFVNKLIWDVQDFDVNVFWLGHEPVKVEVLKINGAKVAPFPESTLLRRSLRSSKDAVLVPTLPG
jgi:hypothetical protein